MTKEINIFVSFFWATTEIKPLCFLDVIMILKLQMNEQQKIVLFCFFLICYTYLLWNWAVLWSLSWTKTNNNKLEQKTFFLVWPKLKWQKMPYGMCYSHFGNGFRNSNINMYPIMDPITEMGCIHTVGQITLQMDIFFDISAIVINRRNCFSWPSILLF